MVLSDLKLTAFKNYEERSFSFKRGVNCIVGKNGLGKTNLLDAIYYLSFAKTAFTNTDSQNICGQHPFFTVRGIYESSLTVACQYEKLRGKSLKVDGQDVERIGNHIGRIPLVLTTPDDNDLIRDGSEYRRKFFDGAIAQLDEKYLQDLVRYNRILKQRNEYLKRAEDPRQVNEALLDSYDRQLVPLANQLVRVRTDFLKQFVPVFTQNYSQLHQGQEVPQVELESAVGGDFTERFRAGRERDIIMKRTLLGPHRDQYQFMMNDRPIKKFGSQGQQKTFILSMKLAEYDLLAQTTGKKPLLLLDDIFDKLDDERIESLISLLDDPVRFEQIFLTDARKERSSTLFAGKTVHFINL
jgi:DNA replication and repair protein RecF